MATKRAEKKQFLLAPPQPSTTPASTSGGMPESSSTEPARMPPLRAAGEPPRNPVDAVAIIAAIKLTPTSPLPCSTTGGSLSTTVVDSPSSATASPAHSAATRSEPSVRVSTVETLPEVENDPYLVADVSTPSYDRLELFLCPSTSALASPRRPELAEMLSSAPDSATTMT